MCFALGGPFNNYVVKMRGGRNILFLSMISAQPDGHMSFLTGQDQTHKFARQVLPDWTESRLMYIFKHFTLQVQVINSHNSQFLDTNLVSKVPRPNK